ncbi:MAG: efflux RND transporter permease subunit [Fulvimonas sp.]|nr:efflux RND transporter permease subunit [Fulvimonas sp.]
MNVSAPFIARPVATSLLGLGLVLAGLLAWGRLPVAPMPEVDVPTIKVSAALPGASPATVAAAVTTPLERALGRIAGLTEMTSTSTDGSSDIRLTFDLSRDVDGAARDVQAAINAARGDLPKDMPGSPNYREVTSSDAPVMVLALTSRQATPAQIYAVAATTFSQMLAQVDGVGQVQLVGSSPPAVRVELDPDALHQRGLGLAQVRRALAAAVPAQPAGGIDIGDRHWQFGMEPAPAQAEALRALVIAERQGAAVRLGDLATVADSVRDPANAALAGGEPAVLALVRRKPGANIVKVVDAIHARLPALRAVLPGDLRVDVIVDRATTVRAALHVAEHTLALAVALVVAVMLLFLRGLRMALIASAAVPIALIGTLAVMYALGYSLDTLSLMALTIAVGFAVDDAVVVVENIARHLEAGMAPWQAARVGAGEVGLTVVSMSAVLVAVFIPLLLMGGYVGLFVREFAVTLAVVITISLVVSLTVVPALCAWWLKPLQAGHGQSRMRRWIDARFAALHGFYDRTLEWALEHAPATLLGLLAVIVLNVLLYAVVPKGFFPRQDTGQLTGDLDVGGGASFALARQKLSAVVDIVRGDPAVASVAGYMEHASGSLYATLKPLSARDASADEVAARLNAKLANIPGGVFVVNSVQNIRVGGRRSRSSNEYTLQADDADTLRMWVPRIVRVLAALPELRNVYPGSQGAGVATALRVDRDAAARHGVGFAAIDGLLSDAFADRRVATLFTPKEPYALVMRVAPRQAQSPQVFDRLEVEGAGGVAVPLPLLARVGQTQAPLDIDHTGQAVSATISFDTAPGVSLSRATRAIDAAIETLAMPTSVRRSLQGSAGAFRQVAASEPALILGALLTLFIVLGILYESPIHPLTILSTLPSAGVGAVLALMLLHTDFDVIALIGIFALIGIVMKNAIMMVDFALAARRELGLDPQQAVRRACRLRFRPILMTSLAVMLAAIPLAVMRGDGAEMHQPLGIAIGGGIIMSQLLTLYTTPVVYLYLDRCGVWIARRLRRALRHGVVEDGGSMT